MNSPLATRYGTNGTPLTPNELNPPEAPFPEFHNVYIHPDDFDFWKNTGTFPDGTVLVKELVTVGSKKAVSGNGYFMGKFIGLEVTTDYNSTAGNLSNLIIVGRKEDGSSINSFDDFPSHGKPKYR